jgi:succinate-semialdehyde dehydrogenase/glutarate-semialdehyde dehydrogenase
MPLISINPANLQTIAETAELSEPEIVAKLDLAEKAFSQWRKTSFAERAELMRKAARYLKDNKERLANIITSEVGKTLPASLAEVEKSALACEYYADNAEKFLASELIVTDASESLVRYDQIGPVLAIMPWNFPFWQVFRFAAPALMAGNVGLLKHASNVQLSAKAIEEVFNASGFPSGAFQNLAIGSAKVESVIRDERIKAVTLTGSEKAGSEVAKVSGQEIKKTVLELGGSDPFIVLADADLDAASQYAVIGRLQSNAGQSCIAAKRFIVEQSVADLFTTKLVEKVRELAVGDPLDSMTAVGPLATTQIMEGVEQQVNESVNQGAEVLVGGKRGETTGNFYLPTVLINVKKGMPVYDEEVFGPVLPVIVVKDAQEAIAVANDSPYGLGATIFSNDVNRAKQLASEIESGSVFINHQVKSDPRLPFGGVKKSGYGRELSHFGIREFVNIKTVWVK